MMSNLHEEPIKRKAMRIGISHFMSRKSDKILQKLGDAFSRSQLTTENRSETLSKQAYKNSVVENVFRQKGMHELMHSLTHKFSDHFLHGMKGEVGRTIKVIGDVILNDNLDLSLEELESVPYQSTEQSLQAAILLKTEQSLQVAIPCNYDFFNIFLK